MALRWVDDELGSMGYRDHLHVATIALGPNEEPDGVVMIRGVAADDRWRWTTWAKRNVKLASGVASTREDAKFGAVRIGLHPRLLRR